MYIIPTLDQYTPPVNKVPGLIIVIKIRVYLSYIGNITIINTRRPGRAGGIASPPSDLDVMLNSRLHYTACYTIVRRYRHVYVCIYVYIDIDVYIYIYIYTCIDIHTHM